MGPRTGRGLGFCGGFEEPGWTRGGGFAGRGGGRGLGRGRGRGRGWGLGRGYGRGPGRGGWFGGYGDQPEAYAQDERDALERERQALSRRLKTLDSLLEGDDPDSGQD